MSSIYKLREFSYFARPISHIYFYTPIAHTLNDRFDWVANALGLTFVDPNSWIEDGDFARDGLHLNGRGKRRLGQLYARVSDLGVGESAGCKI
jgi:hypothetical protein